MTGGNILIADDDAAIRTVLNQALSRAGYEVRTTGTAANLWRWVQSGDGDLVITDVVMPGADGPKLASRLRRERADLPILFITGHAETSELKGERVLQKPFGHVDLADNILQMLGRVPAETVH